MNVGKMIIISLAIAAIGLTGYILVKSTTQSKHVYETSDNTFVATPKPTAHIPTPTISSSPPQPLQVESKKTLQKYTSSHGFTVEYPSDMIAVDDPQRTCFVNKQIWENMKQYTGPGGSVERFCVEYYPNNTVVKTILDSYKDKYDIEPLSINGAQGYMFSIPSITDTYIAILKKPNSAPFEIRIDSPAYHQNPVEYIKINFLNYFTIL